MNVLFCKWEKGTVQSFQRNGAKITLVLDWYDLNYSEITKEDLKDIELVYNITAFDSLDQLNAVVTDLKIKGTKFDYIASFTEFSQYGAGYLADNLGIPNFSMELARSTRDKRVMRMKTLSKGIPGAKFESIHDKDNLEERARVKKNLNFPIVIKPVNGFGAMSTVKIDRESDFDKALDDLVFEEDLLSKQITAEEFVVGEEYHIDALWNGDNDLFFSISKYIVPRISLKHAGTDNGSYVLDENNHREFYDEVRRFHLQVNKSLGLKNGLTHLELFKRDNGELYFSEIGARFGGAAVAEVIESYYQINVREMWAQLAMKPNYTNKFKSNSPFPYVGWVNLTPGKSGKIIKVPSDDILKSNPNILNYEWVRGLDAEIKLSHPSVWCLLLTVGANTEEDYIKVIKQLEKELVIEVE